MTPLTLLLLCLSSQVGVADAPRSARLLAQLDAPTLEAPPPSVAQLQADLAALRRLRPSLVAPVTFLTVGISSAALGGLYLGLSALIGATGGGSLPLLVMGIGALGLGLPLTVLGAWMLHHRLGDRARIDAELRALQQQLQQPHPAPAWPPVSDGGPRAAAVLASF